MKNGIKIVYLYKKVRLAQAINLMKTIIRCGEAVVCHVPWSQGQMVAILSNKSNELGNKLQIDLVKGMDK